jgi:hypothetical protein
MADKQQEALNFNWRIKQVVDIFNEILGNKEFEDANAEKLTQLESALNQQLGRYIRFSGGALKLLLDATENEDGTKKISLSLGISQTVKQPLLDDITNISEDNKSQKIFDLLKNMLLNEEQNAPKELSTTGQFLIYQVDYNTIREIEKTEPGTDNIFLGVSKAERERQIIRSRIKKDIMSGMFSISKASLDYRAEGITFSLPVERIKEYPVETTSMVSTNSTEFQSAETPNVSTETNDGVIVEPTTGSVVREAPQEQSEQAEEVNPSTDTTSHSVKEEKKEETTSKRRTRSTKYDGNYASIGSKEIRRSDRSIVKASNLRSRLEHDGITADKWDNMTPDEKQRIIDCC